MFSRFITKRSHRLCQLFTTSVKLRSLVTCRIKSREVVELSGSDTAKLLQGLITNDVRIIETTPGAVMYSLMLNVKGRVMYDLFIHNVSRGDNPHRYLVDCDTAVTDELITFLSRYKIRKKVQITKMEKDLGISVIIPDTVEEKIYEIPPVDVTLPSVCYPDPRVENFAYRLLHRCENLDIPKDTPNAAETTYTERRYHWGIGEGVTDLPPGNCLPLESNIVFINGASFDKGCYLGQELTARTKYTGVVRKRLVPLLFDSDPGEIEAGVSMTSKDNKTAGKYRNHVGRHGLGLVRLSEIKRGKLNIVSKDGQTIQAEVILPTWWPQECLDAIEQDQCGVNS